MFNNNEKATKRVLAASLLLGALATVIGAYAGARRAGVVPLKHGLMVGLVAGVSALVMLLLPGTVTPPELPFWYHLLGWLSYLPAGIAGGYLGREGAQPAA